MSRDPLRWRRALYTFDIDLISLGHRPFTFILVAGVPKLRDEIGLRIRGFMILEGMKWSFG